MQLRDDVGLDPAKLTEQELAEQAVVSIPLPPPVERDQEQARRLEPAQPFLWAVGSPTTASHSGAHS